MDRIEILKKIDRFASILEDRNWMPESDEINELMVRVAVFDSLWGANGLKAPINPFKDVYETGYGTGITGRMKGTAYYSDTPDYAPLKLQKMTEGMTPQELAKRNQMMYSGRPDLFKKQVEERKFELKYRFDNLKQKISSASDQQLRKNYYDLLVTIQKLPMPEAKAKSDAANRNEMINAVLAYQKDQYDRNIASINEEAKARMSNMIQNTTVDDFSNPNDENLLDTN